MGFLSTRKSHSSASPKVPPDETHVPRRQSCFMPALLLHTRQPDSGKPPQQLRAPFCFQDLETAKGASASRGEKHPRRGRGDFFRALVFLVPSEQGSLGRARQGWDPALTAPRSGKPTVGLLETSSQSRMMSPHLCWAGRGAGMTAFALFLFWRMSHGHSSASPVLNPSPSP